jgi:hypothetical protein
MAPARYFPDAEFAPAALGTRVRIMTLVTIVATVVLGAVVGTGLVTDSRSPRWLVVKTCGILPLVFAAIWFTARIQRYRLVGMELQIERRFGTARFSLEGLQQALPDREALRGARTIKANAGLRAISGRFRSKRLGRFHAYVTDAEHAVVLRWPDRCVVISPEQHSFFIETVRKRAGLSP